MNDANDADEDSMDLDPLKLFPLKLLKQTIFGGDDSNNNNMQDVEDMDDLKISIIQSLDSSTVFLRASDDDKIHFVAFRKVCFILFCFLIYIHGLKILSSSSLEWLLTVVPTP